MLSKVATMRDLIRELSKAGAEALVELREFRYAIVEVLQNIEVLHRAARALQADVETHASTEFRTSAEALTVLAEQILHAYRQLEVGMRDWALDGNANVRSQN